MKKSLAVGHISSFQIDPKHGFESVVKMRIASMEISARQGHEAGRALLARLYREYTGKEMPPILVTDRGKPYFSGEKTGDGTVSSADTVPSPVLHFSISHTKGHVFCVLSEKPVGIDAEEMDRNIDLRLAEKILSPAEKQRYEAARDKRSALLKLWVLKEAHAKLTGQGLRGYPNQTDFDPDDPRIKEMNGCYVAVLNDKHEFEMER